MVWPLLPVLAMKRLLLASTAFALLGAPSAQADSVAPTPGQPVARPGHFVALGAILSAEHEVSGGITGEVLTRIGDSPGFVHGMLHVGSATNLFGRVDGSYQQVRGGAELRGCRVSSKVCRGVGLDVGYHHAAYEVTSGFFGPSTTSSEAYASAVVVPRLTIDAGHSARFRAALEFPYHHDLTGEHDNRIGVALAVGLGTTF